MHILLTGQTLIKRSIDLTSNEATKELFKLIQQDELSFTNFEGTVLGNYRGWPTKNNAVSACPPEVFHQMGSMGFDILSLANNHAYDLGSEGILSTIEEAGKGDFLYAGIGKNADEASKVRYMDYSNGKVGLLAIDCSGQPQYCYALNAKDSVPTRPGMNRLQVFRDENNKGYVDKEDADRQLDAIKEAATQADTVIVYIHNHHWEEPRTRTPEWLQIFARNCIDAGATIFVGHGVPLLQGMDLYKGHPIFYSLGNFIFHSSMPEKWLNDMGTGPWQSVLIDCEFAKEKIPQIVFYPIAVGGNIYDKKVDVYTGNPAPLLLTGEAGHHILSNFKQLSSTFGVNISIAKDSSYAWINP